nr:hypothetical protein [uncultured Niameybacter sp.]
MKEILLKDILEITKAQKEALEKSDLEKFEELLTQKQVKIDAIDKLHKEQPGTKAEKHEDLLKEIISLDGSNKIEFERQFEEVKKNLQNTRDEMNNLRQRQYVNYIYNNPYDISDEEGIFYDKR